MTAELTRLRARYAKAHREQPNTPLGSGHAASVPDARTSPAFIHEAAMRHARAVLADLQHKRRDILTLRETMAFGGVRP
jgi:hypothetical protein